MAGSGTGAFLDGLGTSASFNVPMDLMLDPSGNIIVCDRSNQKIRKVSTSGTFYFTLFYFILFEIGLSSDDICHEPHVQGW